MEHLIFRMFQVNAKDMKCHFQWWKKEYYMFLTFDFLRVKS